ncbi:MAG: (S)-ureidoglycine aminohydrolase [Clostridium argentinense]|uniref:(S)-ureidoglycine aminohydrolase n=1 Tax=uncultured Clostridium sp. TaxID=59620 RepID=UPI001DC40E25|nr:(S)-ureidoglycine aminohydrolase [uncultured Clostridium sp.]MBS5823872.1 (S)-ureidoglycine aminohydrolase [Clostridium argentinense]MDU1350738.1 (S)-ureidoglycine aminohydrolase [Clostridium argentinense]
MSYLNGVTGYREDILANRSIIKRGNFALIEPDGIVKNVIPNFENCEVTILSSPKLGASFVDYLLNIEKGGHSHLGFGEDGIETFLYVFEGDLKVWNEEKEAQLTDGGFIFCPENRKLYFENTGDKKVRAFLYKRKYEPIEGRSAYTVIGNINDIEWMEYEGMKDVLVKDFLPSATDIGFDMNFHILSFKPGACHGYIETHVQEHGAYIYSGQGMYNLDNNWIPVKKGDYLFMGAYSLQAAYGVGRDEDFAYIYSKDCNRDIKL